jgi:hypothetical protein
MFRLASRGPGVESLIAPAAFEEFSARQSAVAETIRAHGLDDGHAVLIGGAGLAAYGLDSYVDLSENGHSPFDVDAFVDAPTFQGLQGAQDAYSRPESNPTEVHVPGSAITLPVSGLRTPLSGDFAYTYRCNTMNELRARAVNVGGTLVMTPTELAHAKLSRGDLKDSAGILKVHFVAWNTEHPITEDARWQWNVIAARNTIQRRAERSRAVRRALPSWLGQLLATDFDHPAFTSLNPPILALRAS